MYFKISLLVVSLLVTSTVASAQTEQKYKYLVDAINRMSAAIGQSPTPSSQVLIQVTSEGCNALRTLLDDKQFQSDLTHLSGQAPGTQKERKEIKRELYLFVTSFLHAEEQALKKAGLSQVAIKELLWAASFFRNSLDDNFEPKRILNSIQKLKNELFKASGTLQAQQDDTKRSALVRKWVFRISGVLLIVADIPIASINPPVAVGSGCIGTAIASWSD